jgi:hypothetical protein
MEIQPSTQLRPHEHVAGKIMDGELVAINLRTGLYYSSTGIGPVIWELMEAGQTSAAIAGAIARHLNVAPDRVEIDVKAFLSRLVEEDLVAHADGADRLDDVTIAYGGAYEPPSLTAFDDMEQAFALDPPLRA